MRFRPTALPCAFEFILVLLGVFVIVLVYLPIWTIIPFADDLAIIQGAEVGLFEGGYAGRIQFRPLEVLTIQSSFYLFNSPILVTIISFLGFLFCIGLVFWIARISDRNRPIVAVLAAAFFACHPANVSAIFQVDTISQQLASVFVLCGFAWYTFGPFDHKIKYHCVGAGLSLLALLSKEISAGAILALPLAAVLVQRFVRRSRPRVVAHRCLFSTAITIGLLLTYVSLRALSGATLTVEDGRYAFSDSPILVLKNAILLLGSMGYLGSTLEIFLLDSPIRLIVSVLLSAAVHVLALLGFVWLLIGHRQGDADRQSLIVMTAVALLLLASLFPAVLIKHVSELYAYLGVPFYSLLLGFFVYRGWERAVCWLALTTGWTRVLGSMFVASCCVWLLLAVSEKLAFAERMGLRSESLSEQIAGWYFEGETPLGSAVSCVATGGEPSKEHVYYSVFEMSDQELLRYAHAWVASRHAALVGRKSRHPTADQCQVMIEVGDDGHLRLRPVSP